ncbi:hypothetical protein LIPSTDRAFT_191473 [Lipomyces starkeyi NRRL Y-11557]|uniref:Uncharacterized protein n=1 Tax=Lipomyces starkeyi NRRL Y-11557 TaxID=675824 RepID=A0A1E3PW07_LIPST|nr:hypothetical protein LIPSTDRAFT_191473 [Lipomyces starkeyi NRRL Y-11557]
MRRLRPALSQDPQRLTFSVLSAAIWTISADVSSLQVPLGRPFLFSKTGGRFEIVPGDVEKEEVRPEHNLRVTSFSLYYIYIRFLLLSLIIIHRILLFSVKSYLYFFIPII